MPNLPRPIYIIGAGGIVNDAHLPAYALAGFNVAGIYDINYDRALLTARRFSVPKIFKTLQELIRDTEPEVVFDVAVPADSLIEVLEQLPEKSVVLMQKPMGSDLREAITILELTQARQQIAAVNFQLRYTSAILEARKMINSGSLGDICDIEVNVNVYTPWHLWTFLYDSPRVEILYHSIHYIDLIRSFLGNPSGVYAKTVKHPGMSQLASVRSTIIMDYGDMIRAAIHTNHCHQFGTTHQQSYIKLEGTMGAVRITIGVLQNYPKGEADKFEYILLNEQGKGEWQSLNIEHTWFPHAFAGSMTELIFAADHASRPDHSVEDCIHTMACVEAAYLSNEKGSIRLEDVWPLQ